jgi:hypothetical protein
MRDASVSEAPEVVEGELAAGELRVSALRGDTSPPAPPVGGCSATPAHLPGADLNGDPGDHHPPQRTETAPVDDRRHDTALLVTPSSASRPTRR